jgi:hypothetical protein
MGWIELNWLADAELLRRLGRGALAGLLAMLTPFLALPNPNEPDDRYFPQLAAALRRLPLKVIAFLPPLFEGGCPVPAPLPSAGGIPSLQDSRQPRYALRREGGIWHLTFDGQQTAFTQGLAVLYVTHLFRRPGIPISAARLVGVIQGRRGSERGLTGIPAPEGGSVLPEAGGIVEEPADRIGDSRALRELRRQHAELEALLDDEQASEPEKAEAERELEQNEKLQHQYLGRFQDTAEKAARAVRKSIYRFRDTLRAPPRGQSVAHPLLVRFADHLEKHLIIPSQRYSGRRARIARADLAGCLTYEPPHGVVWLV